MAPRRREQGPHAVELVEVTELDEDFDAGWAPPAGRSHAATVDEVGAVPERRARRRGGLHGVVVLVVVLVVCAVVLSVLVGGVLERRRADRVAAQPGGLRPLAEDPVAVWSAPTVQVWPAVVDGQAVLVASDGTVTARDLVTGEPTWRAALPAGRTSCGPDLLDPDGAGSTLVCVTDRSGPDPAEAPQPGAGGRPDDGFPYLVTVLDGAGQVVGARGLGDEVEAAAPLSGGRLATAARRDGSVVVTWADALDGTVLGTRTLDDWGAPVDAVGSRAVEGTSSVPASTDYVQMQVRRGELRVRTFSTAGVFDARGADAVEQVRSTRGERGWVADGGLPDGLSARVRTGGTPGQEEQVDVVGPDGEPLFSLAGEPFVPEVADREFPEVLLTRVPGFTGFDASTGERLWHRPEWPEVLWLQTDDVVVVESGSRLLAFESRSGRASWQRWMPTEIERVLTDGDSMVLVTRGGLAAGDGFVTVTALSLLDGHVEWRRSIGGGEVDVGAVQGMLFAVTGTEVRRLGRRARTVGDLSHR